MKTIKSVYLIGALKNPRVPAVANELRHRLGLDVFDDWWAASEDADDWWMGYENGRGHKYAEAFGGHHADTVFASDKKHLDRCDAAVLLMPAGKSGHLELGYMAGCGKPTFILFDQEPERFDIMYRFAVGGVHFSTSTLLQAIKERMVK